MLKLCYVKEPWAWFTTNRNQTGDDWDDAPYEFNAEPPRADEGHNVIKVAWGADLIEPREGLCNSPFSVDSINMGAVAWLRSPEWADHSVIIPAWTTLKEFVRLVRLVGGNVYMEREDWPLAGEL